MNKRYIYLPFMLVLYIVLYNTSLVFAVPCPTSGNLNVASGTTCNLPTGSYTYSSGVIEGTVIIDSDINGNVDTTLDFGSNEVSVINGGQIGASVKEGCRIASLTIKAKSIFLYRSSSADDGGHISVSGGVGCCSGCSGCSGAACGGAGTLNIQTTLRVKVGKSSSISVSGGAAKDSSDGGDATLGISATDEGIYLYEGGSITANGGSGSVAWGNYGDGGDGKVTLSGNKLQIELSGGSITANGGWGGEDGSAAIIDTDFNTIVLLAGSVTAKAYGGDNGKVNLKADTIQLSAPIIAEVQTGSKTYRGGDGYITLQNKNPGGIVNINSNVRAEGGEGHGSSGGNGYITVTSDGITITSSGSLKAIGESTWDEYAGNGYGKITISRKGSTGGSLNVRGSIIAKGPTFAGGMSSRGNSEITINENNIDVSGAITATGTPTSSHRAASRAGSGIISIDSTDAGSISVSGSITANGGRSGESGGGHARVTMNTLDLSVSNSATIAANGGEGFRQSDKNGNGEVSATFGVSSIDGIISASGGYGGCPVGHSCRGGDAKIDLCGISMIGSGSITATGGTGGSGSGEDQPGIATIKECVDTMSGITLTATNGNNMGPGTIDTSDCGWCILPTISPEVCDGIDNNYDGKVDYINTMGDLDNSCGVDTSCRDYYCNEGVGCAYTNYNTNTLCNSVYKCSSGSGDNKYNGGGDYRYRCQGYCDGFGNCDYAGNCQQCSTDSTDYDDSSTAYKTASKCIDYTGCSNGQCISSTYKDYCEGLYIIRERYDSGSGCGTSSAYDCKNYESNYCKDDGRYYHSEYICALDADSQGYCKQSGEIRIGSDSDGNGYDNQCESCDYEPARTSPTTESISAGNCNNGIDDDCDGTSMTNFEADWDTLDRGAAGRVPIHGDNGCPIEIKSITVSNNNPNPGETIEVKCESSVANVNSILVYIDSNLCVWKSWDGNKAAFDCNVGTTTGSKTVRCTVDTSKSYQTGTDKTKSITVNIIPSDCSTLSQSDCNSAPNCEWCPECSGVKYSGGTNRCVTVGTCNYYCWKGKCGASCDSTQGGCIDTSRCDGNLYQTRTASCSSSCTCSYGSWIYGTCSQSVNNCGGKCDENSDCSNPDDACTDATHIREYSIYGTCLSSCTCSQDSGTIKSCGGTNCDSSKHLTGYCNNPCVSVSGDDYCGTCTPTYPGVCSCQANYYDIDGDTTNGCEYSCTPNILVNGDFEIKCSGFPADPDAPNTPGIWVHEGSLVSIGCIQGVTGNGVEVIESDPNYNRPLKQLVNNWQTYVGKKLTLTVQYRGDQNTIFIRDDGTGTWNTKTCPSTSSWTECSVTRTIPSNAKYVYVGLVPSPTGTTRYDNVVLTTGESCDGVDNDCNGAIDEGCDDDKDNYCDTSMSCSGNWFNCNSGSCTDCNDNNANIHPGKTEICNNNIDDECDSFIDYADSTCVRITGIDLVGVRLEQERKKVTINEPFEVKCTTSARTNCLGAKIGNNICTWRSWSGNTATFECIPTSLGTKTVKCWISNKNDVDGNGIREHNVIENPALYSCTTYGSSDVGGDPPGSDQEDEVDTESSDCSTLSQSDCNSAPNCEWCPECSGVKYNNLGSSTCVDLGFCTYGCDRDPLDLVKPYDYCAAECDNDDSPCMNQCPSADNTILLDYPEPCDVISTCKCPTPIINLTCTSDIIGTSASCGGTSYCCSNCNGIGWAVSVEESINVGNCADGYDNDCDGYIDSEDTDCGKSDCGDVSYCNKECPNEGTSEDCMLSDPDCKEGTPEHTGLPGCECTTDLDCVGGAEGLVKCINNICITLVGPELEYIEPKTTNIYSNTQSQTNLLFRAKNNLPIPQDIIFNMEGTDVTHWSYFRGHPEIEKTIIVNFDTKEEKIITVIMKPGVQGGPYDLILIAKSSILENNGFSEEKYWTTVNLQIYIVSTLESLFGAAPGLSWFAFVVLILLAGYLVSKMREKKKNRIKRVLRKFF